MLVHFEAEDLFVLADVEGFGSFDEARPTLAGGVSLSFEGEWVSLVCRRKRTRTPLPLKGWPATMLFADATYLLPRPPRETRLGQLSY